MSEERIVKEEPLPDEWRGRRVGLLDALLRDRQQVRMKHAFWFVTGIETVDSFFPFIQGWNANTQLNGGYDLAWQEFKTWFQETRGEPLREDWYVKPLRDCQGDHERVVLMFLDLIAEYVERFGLSPRGTAGAMDERVATAYGPLPKEWGGRRVGILDALLWIRRRMSEGRELSFITGSDTIDSLYSFTIGWARNNASNAREDLVWQSFCVWLRDVKKEFPGEGWHIKYLEDCQGDHRKAVLKYLDFAAEFMGSR
jgi:hypothetical protein